LIVQVEFFLPGLSQNADRFFRSAIDQEISFQPESFMTLLGNQCILPGEIAFGKTEIMNGVQQISLANSISPANTYDPFAETEFPGKIVFELSE
jgi:hypothetical protein